MISEIFDKKPFRKSLVISVFLIFLGSCYHQNQILMSSKYYQLALSIPAQSLAMYMVKLYSVRNLFTLFGSVFEFYFHKFTGFKRAHYAMFFCGMLYTTRLVMWVYLLMYNEPAVIFYYMTNFEAFVNGLFQVCFQITFASFMSVLMISKDCCYILAAIIQMVINWFYHDDPAMVVLIQHFISFFFGFLGFVLWFFFVCRCRELALVYDNNYVDQLRNLIEYFKVEISSIGRNNNLMVHKEALILMLHDKENLLDYVYKEIKKALEGDEQRTEYARKLVEEIRNEYKNLEKILNKENAITAESKISPEALEMIVFCEEKINSKRDMLKNLIDEAYLERRKLEDTFDIEKNLEESETNSEENLWAHFVNVISPFLMIIPSVFYRQVYPTIYPNGLVEKTKANLAILLIPFGFIVGTVWTWYLEKYTQNLSERFKRYLRAWLSLIPLWLGFVGSIVPVHTDWGFFRKVPNSTARVTGIGFCMMASYAIMRSTSNIQIANYIVEKSKNRNSSSRLISYHNIITLTLNYVFFKMVLSYNQGKTSLGYIPPNFQVSNDLRATHTLWFWIKHIFSRTILEMIRDFGARIRIYT